MKKKKNKGIRFLLMGLVLGMIAYSTSAFSQSVSGTVYFEDTDTLYPLSHAHVYWSARAQGVMTNADGHFSIKATSEEKKLVISHVGFLPDTLTYPSLSDKHSIVLVPESSLDGITITSRRKGTPMLTTGMVQTQVISQEGLQRLACCNLAESFENNPTVDVGYADAVSGARQIQMLGLAGRYSQLMVCGHHTVRMLSAPYGLHYIPGPWLESISVSKGTSSVANGYESITGQINAEIKRAEDSDRLYVDYFGNDFLRQELNLNTSFDINNELSTIFLLHGSHVGQEVDHTNNGFMDVPKTNLVVASNRYFYLREDNKIRSRFGFDVLYEDRTGGEIGFDKNKHKGTTEQYGIHVESKRFSVFEHTGYLINQRNNQSVALNAHGVYHDQRSYYGLRQYNATEQSMRADALFKSDLRTNSHTMNSGISFSYDGLDEQLADTSWEQQEMVTGAFAEYTFQDFHHWTYMAGIRADYSSRHGAFVTPRMHVRYAPTDNATFRVSAGRGMRTAYVIPENIGILASSREIIIEEELRQEQAWNYGANFTQRWFFDQGRQLTFSIDYYRTDFQNQVVIDMDRATDRVYFHNLRGASFSNSFQTDLIVEPVRNFEITLAYRYNDVKTTLNDQLVERPLNAKHKGITALHYATLDEKWKFSFTTQYHGSSRLPNTADNPVAYRLPERSPSYFILHSQITRTFSPWEIYVGIENLTNYKQTNPILAADDPFSNYFDSSIIYAPIVGRHFYLGLRLRI